MKNSEDYKYTNCNLCNSNDYSIKYKPTISDFNPEKVFSASHGIRGTQQIVKCKTCGLIYVNPRINPKMIVNAYSDSQDELYVSQAQGRITTFLKSLKFVERYAPAKGRILDVGAAAGFFLYAAKSSGWQTYGVEPSKWMADWGNAKYAVNIKPGVLCGSKYDSNFFDVVTMWDVLEHTADPMSELRETNRILKKDGILIINYPNIGSTLARLAGSKWWFLLSVHLFYFNHKTITKYLEANGFEVVKISRYMQTLNLEHLVAMFGLYNQFVSKLGIKIVKALKINNWQIPYYASQANVVARKTTDI